MHRMPDKGPSIPYIEQIRGKKALNRLIQVRKGYWLLYRLARQPLLGLASLGCLYAATATSKRATRS